nr:hypothetical protein [Gemella sp. zg-570]
MTFSKPFSFGCVIPSLSGAALMLSSASLAAFVILSFAASF